MTSAINSSKNSKKLFDPNQSLNQRMQKLTTPPVKSPNVQSPALKPEVVIKQEPIFQ